MGILQKCRLHIKRSILYAVSLFIIIGLLTWFFCPMNGARMICFFIVLAYFTYLLKPKHVKTRRIIVLYFLIICEIIGIATWHDLTVITYATARCCDGSYSYSEHSQGTCSWHKGVCRWHPELSPWWKTIHGN